MTIDPLDQFFETPEKLEGRLREKLASMIVPFAAADPVDGTIHPKNAWHALDAKKKILVFLLSRLALSTKNPDISSGLSPAELEEMTGLPGGTVRPKLSSLVKDHAIHKDAAGQYSVRATSIAIDNAFALMEDSLQKNIK
ncbi:MAG: hypothetical protein KIT07_02900 [Anaerolineales bacterium]|nr:hypothetical protein [Anaerolineales bacterium]